MAELEALRCLKPRISDAFYRQLLADTERAQLLGAAADSMLDVSMACRLGEVVGRVGFGHAALMPNHEEFNRELAAAARGIQDEDSRREAMERASASTPTPRATMRFARAYRRRRPALALHRANGGSGFTDAGAECREARLACLPSGPAEHLCW